LYMCVCMYVCMYVCIMYAQFFPKHPPYSLPHSCIALKYCMLSASLTLAIRASVYRKWTVIMHEADKLRPNAACWRSLSALRTVQGS
jgi:hypothetical protein